MFGVWVLLVVLGLLAGVVLLASCFYFLTRPKPQKTTSYAELPAILRELAAPLHNRGTLYVSHSEAAGDIWIRKHVYKSRPNQLELRFRNADETRWSFATGRQALDQAGVEYELELTRVRQQPRAIVACFPANEPTSYSALAHLLQVLFAAMTGGSPGKLSLTALDGFDRHRVLPQLKHEAATAGPLRSRLIRRYIRKLGGDPDDE